jgi:uncharacterized alpha-E superfamily protein
MLSRVANSLYWMSRYIERAENIARILDVNLQLLLDFRDASETAQRDHWSPIVQCTGDEELFEHLHGRAAAASVCEFMVFQETNPNSIISSICQARENARMVRDQITFEMWEEINRLYLFITSQQARRLWSDSPTDFFNQIKNSSLLLIGLGDATLIRNEGWWFTQVGKFIERADKTSRILDVRYQSLPAQGLPQVISQADALGWSAVLRSCSAWDAYKSIHGAEVDPRLVAEFLLLNEDFPRSVRFCADEMNTALRCISGVSPGRFVNDAEKLAGRLVAEFQFTTIDEVFAFGLHVYLDEVQKKLNAIGEALFNAYIFHAFNTSMTDHFVQQEEQQQQAAKVLSAQFSVLSSGMAPGIINFPN